MVQIKSPQRNQQKDDASFIEFDKNETTNEFTQSFISENSKENSLNLSLNQNNKRNSINNTKEKKKTIRYYQVRNKHII